MNHRPLASLVLLALAIAIPARAQTELDVAARDDYFLPSITHVPRGGTVVWGLGDAERSHSITDSSGMGLFDSGIVAPGGPSFSYRFTAAGSYPYACTLHVPEMNGRVEVPLDVSPTTGPRGRPFRVRWATGPAPGGLAYDVQIRRPGESWAPWRAGETAPSARFVAHGAGRYRFRARLVAPSSGRSGWSGSDSIRVN